VTKPLAVVFYESLLPGSRLVNRLTDLGYRVQTVTAAQELAATLLREPPMVLVAQLNPRGDDLPAIVAAVKGNPSLAHLPVIGYLPPRLAAIEARALAAGVNLVAAETAVLDQLPQLLEHALAVD
jgi:CheY-like chemotaxis protein